MNLREELNKCELVPACLAIGLLGLYSFIVYLSYLHPTTDISNIRLEVKDFMLIVMGFYFIEKHYRKRHHKGKDHGES